MWVLWNEEEIYVSVRLRARWQVGNGKSISFWKDVWLEETLLLLIAKQLVCMDELQMKVFKYWEQGNGWILMKLAEVLPSVTLLKLASINLDLAASSPDQVGWLGTTGKRYSVSSAYKLAADWSKEERWPGWKRI